MHLFLNPKPKTHGGNEGEAIRESRWVTGFRVQGLGAMHNQDPYRRAFAFQGLGLPGPPQLLDQQTCSLFRAHLVSLLMGQSSVHRIVSCVKFPYEP